MVIYDDRIKCVYRPLRQFKRYSFANATSMHSNDAIHRRITRSQTTKIPNKTQEKKWKKRFILLALITKNDDIISFSSLFIFLLPLSLHCVAFKFVNKNILPKISRFESSVEQKNAFNCSNLMCMWNKVNAFHKCAVFLMDFDHFGAILRNCYRYRSMHA